MNDGTVIIVGGGLAGLSAGCYALRSGFRATIVEHNLALGGVCTAWPRGPYTIDGCIHWLMGGAFQRLYEELAIVPSTPLRTLDTWATYRDVRDGLEIPFTRDLDALVARLLEVSARDAGELARLRDGVAAMSSMAPPIDAPELTSVGDMLRSFWEMRGAVSSLVHFRAPIGEWAHRHLESQRLRRLFTRIMPETTPTAFLLVLLGYLEKGLLSRPVGGTTAFRDALERTYRSLGGEARLHATVDEILVEHGRARGVRLADGTMLRSDIVVSTSSGPETVLRLLGGRYDADVMRERLAQWRMFDPIVLASFGVAASYPDAPSLSVLDGISSFEVGGRPVESMSVRVCNDDPSFAPVGHTVVQALIPTDYDWWATRGARYGAEKDALAEHALTALKPHLPGLEDAVRMIDLATPLTYWGMARSWRGAYEGWMPSSESMFGHVKKKLSGLEGLYMAGQWVEPGGGVPTALMSGRQAIQLVCHDDGRPFVSAGGA